MFLNYRCWSSCLEHLWATAMKDSTGPFRIFLNPAILDRDHDDLAPGVLGQ